jgi:WD40 repeat protein
LVAALHSLEAWGIAHQEQNNMMKKLSLFLSAIVLLVLSPLPSEAQEIEDFHEIRRFGQYPVEDIAWHPDGATLAIKQGNAIILYTDTFEMIETFPILSPTIDAYGEEIGWSPDGDRIAILADYIHTLGVLDVTTGTWEEDDDPANLSQRLPWRSGNQPRPMMYDFAWNPDGTLVAITNVREIQLKDTNTYEIVNVLQAETEEGYAIQRIAWSPDGVYLAAARTTGKGIEIWDMATLELVTILTGDFERIRSLDWNFDGTRLASANGNNVQIWDAANWELTIELHGHADEIYRVTWNPVDNRIATRGLDNTVRIWDGNSGEQLELFQPFTLSIRIAWSPDSTRIAASSDGKIYVLNATTGSLDMILDDGNYYRDSERFVSWLTDNLLLSIGGVPPYVVPATPLNVWNTTTQEIVFTSEIQGNRIGDVSINGDKSLMAILFSDHTIQVLNTDTWEIHNLEYEYEPHPDYPFRETTDIQFSNGGKYIAIQVLAHDGPAYLQTLYIVEIRTGQIALSAEEASFLLWHPTENQMMYELQGNVYTWDEATDVNFVGNILPGIWHISWHSSGQYMAVSRPYEATIGILDAQYRQVDELIGHTGEIQALAWSPDGSMLASVGSYYDDPTIRIWGE